MRPPARGNVQVAVNAKQQALKSLPYTPNSAPLVPMRSRIVPELVFRSALQFASGRLSGTSLNGHVHWRL